MLSQLITELIEIGGLTQQQIGDKCGRSQSYISDLQNGHRGKRVSYETQRSIQTLHASVVGRRRSRGRQPPATRRPEGKRSRVEAR